MAQRKQSGTQSSAIDVDPSLSADGSSTLIKQPTLAAVELPFETDSLRKGIASFVNKHIDLEGSKTIALGAIKWGVYAFYDYDGEPIYVGQTKERLGTRIRRHLTNQRTDAVAMNVLDPFEVFSIAAWPLTEYQDVGAKHPHYPTAVVHLNALEHAVFVELVAKSEFGVVLNEKDPVCPAISIELPASFKDVIVSAEVSRLRDHPDLRLARRAATIAKLAQVISERKVQRGLRRTLHVQAQRLQSLASKRYQRSSEVVLEEGDEVGSANDT